MSKSNKKAGGKRQGAGRKKQFEYPTTVLRFTYLVPKEASAKLKTDIQNLISESRKKASDK